MFHFVITALGKGIHGIVEIAWKKLSNGVVKTELRKWTHGIAKTEQGNKYLVLSRLDLDKGLFCQNWNEVMDSWY